MRISLPAPTDLTATDLPVPRDPWVGHTEDDATRIAAALAATHAASTRKVYAFAWRRWVSWCAGRGIGPFPAEPAAVGRAPRRPTRPLSVADLRQIVAAIDRSTDRGFRDTAMLLLGFAGALRRSELAALTLADLEPKPGGLLLHLRRSKTDQEARGQVVGIAQGQHGLTDPIAALDAWLAIRGTAAGPVFTSLRKGGPALRPLSGNAVSALVKDRALAAGFSSGRISGHSLRVGHATSAALAGISVDRIAAQTRHRRIDILIDRYIRPVHALQTTSSRDLGL